MRKRIIGLVLSFCMCISLMSPLSAYAENEAVVLRSDLLQLMNLQRSEIDKQFYKEEHTYYEGPAVIWWYQNFGAYFGDYDDDYIWDEYDEAMCENVQPKVLFTPARYLIDVSSDTVSAEQWEQTFGEGSVLEVGTNEMDGDYLVCVAGEYEFYFTELDENHCIRKDSYVEIHFRIRASVELVDVSDYEYYAILTCLKDEKTMWEYQSKTFPKTELVAASDVYIHKNVVYAAFMGELFCFNKNNGEILWSVPDVGESNAIAFDKTGNIYISGYYGPNITVIDPFGTVLYKDESEDYGWVSALKAIDSTLQIYYYLGEECTERYGAKKEIDISVFQKPEIQVLLNNMPVVFDQPPVIVDNRTLVPLRAIFEAMGATVDWDNTTRTATGHGKQGYDVIVTENSDTAYIDGFPYKLDVPVKSYNGRLLAPARFVAEAFGGYVGWDSASQTVTIQSLSANVSENRSYDENARYETCYDAAMTHGRLVYIADGYKAIVLRNGYIDKVGDKYRFVNAQGISDQRYYFNIVNELVTDYELAERLDFVYNVNNNDYESRSEYWTEKVNVNDEMAEFKETYSLAVDLLKTGATFLNAGYVLYDAGKLVFDQMVVGTIYPPYIEASLKNLPSELAKTTTRMGFDGIILCGLVGSVDEFNSYCDTIAEIYNKYGYGYITSLEDAERFITAVSGQYLLIKQAEAVGLYLKTTYPQKTIPKILGDMANNIVVNFVGTPDFEEVLESKKTLKKVYDGVGEVKTYIEGINAEGNVVICKNGTDAFFDANDIIMRNCTLDETNSKYIELIKKIR